MKTILITGLDGSGKSTFFKELKSNISENDVIIEVPKVDFEALDSNAAVFPFLVQLKELGEYADKFKSPEAKALAFFGTMLCFHEIINLKQKENTDHILCERHPLIDAAVYARFYSPKLNPELIKADLMNDLDLQFTTLLNYLLAKLPADIKFNYQSPSGKLFQFIFEFFKEKTAPAIADMERIFRVNLPDSIYFLQAPAEILFNRLSSRKQMEPHETLSTLTKLNDVYESDLQLIAHYYHVPVTFIDASSFDSLDEFRYQFCKSLKPQTAL
jgi:thymidylate kinase